MAGMEENRIFVGGLSLNTTERELEDAFRRYGKVVDSLIVSDRDTGRSRGFGFVTFSDHRGMDDAIRGMHDREIDGRVVSVNKAQPKAGGDDRGYGGRSHGGREHAPIGRDSYRGERERPVGGSTDCFKCGRPGHFARECPSAGLGGGDRFSSHLRTGGGGSGHGDRYAPDRFDDRFDGGRYGDRERVDPRESRFGARDRFSNDRYPPVSDRFGGDKFIDREPPLNGYGRDRGYSRDGPRGGGGPAARYERGSFRDRAGPYDRPRRGGGRPPSYERY